MQYKELFQFKANKVNICVCEISTKFTQKFVEIHMSVESVRTTRALSHIFHQINYDLALINNTIFNLLGICL